MLRAMIERLRMLFLPGAVTRGIDEELRGHIEAETARNLARGMNAAGARRAAQRAFGNIDAHRDAARAAYGWLFIDQLRQDLHYAARTLLGSPLLSAAAVLSLALALGATTAMFSALDALLLRRLAVRAPEQLVTLEQMSTDGAIYYNYSFGDYEAFRASVPLFADVTATTWADGFNIAIGESGFVDEAQSRVSVVTGNYFTMMGVSAARGRTFSEVDDRAGADPVVVISQAYWTRAFARAPDVIGQTITMLGTKYTVVGVTPRAFQGEWVGWPTDIWVPASNFYQVFPGMGSGPRGGRMQYKLIARLKDGVTREQAQAAGALVHKRIARERASGSGVDPDARFVLTPAAAGYSSQRMALEQPMITLMAIVGVVLLIACANVANLLLARAAARERELMVRQSLGASRARVFRQLLTESLVLAFAAGLLSLGVARAGTYVLQAFARSGPARSVTMGASSVVLDLEPSARIFLFSFLMCGATGALFGVVPAFRGARLNTLKSRAGHGRQAGARGWPTLRTMLVVGQIALSLALLSSAALLVRTRANLKNSDFGFARDRLLLAWTLPGYSGAARPELLGKFRAIEQRVASLPGVESASATVNGVFSGLPTGGPALRAEDGGSSVGVQPDGLLAVGRTFFETTGQRVLLGRPFALFDDESSQRVLIVDEAFARRVFGRTDVVGRRLVTGRSPEASANPYSIVGVVSNATYGSPRDKGGGLVYAPYTQARNLTRLCLVVRTNGSAADVKSHVRAELRALDPQLPVLEIATADEQLDHLLFRDHLITRLSLFFGGFALLLACIGLFGVMAYDTARRTGEIGVRMALGATQARVLRMTLQQMLVVVGAGVLLGVVVALAAGRTIAALLYGVRPADPLTMAFAALVLVGVATAATLLPAVRAARVSPAVALRGDP